MSDEQAKIYSARLYCLECPALFGNRTSKNLGVLVHRTSEHFKIFLPLNGLINRSINQPNYFNSCFWLAANAELSEHSTETAGTGSNVQVSAIYYQVVTVRQRKPLFIRVDL